MYSGVSGVRVNIVELKSSSILCRGALGVPGKTSLVPSKVLFSSSQVSSTSSIGRNDGGLSGSLSDELSLLCHPGTMVSASDSPEGILDLVGSIDVLISSEESLLIILGGKSNGIGTTPVLALIGVSSSLSGSSAIRVSPSEAGSLASASCLTGDGDRGGSVGCGGGSGCAGVFRSVSRIFFSQTTTQSL